MLLKEKLNKLIRTFLSFSIFQSLNLHTQKLQKSTFLEDILYFYLMQDKVQILNLTLTD